MFLMLKMDGTMMKMIQLHSKLNLILNISYLIKLIIKARREILLKKGDDVQPKKRNSQSKKKYFCF